MNLRTGFIRLVLIGNLFQISSCKQQAPDKILSVRQTLLRNTDSLTSHLSALLKEIRDPSPNETQIQDLFLQCRRAFKKLEWAAEYFTPTLALTLNGPPVPELEESGITLVLPSGLQVIETYLFPKPDLSQVLLNTELEKLISNTARLKSKLTSQIIQDWQLLEAAKLEIFRVETLGITGFDNPLTKKSMAESAEALLGIKELISELYGETEEPLSSQIDSAMGVLHQNPDFETFDRMAFILNHANPVSRNLERLSARLKFRGYKYNLLLNQDAPTLFDSGVFNLNAYAPDHSSFLNPDKIKLGQKLFGDPILSGDGKRSCASCHQPGKYFTDGLARNSIVGSRDLLDRNTPTLINAALQPALFYDLRVNSLEDQAHSVVHSHKEMKGSMKLTVENLKKDSDYIQMFRKAFPREDKNRIDTFEIMNALGSYIRSVTHLDSKWDQHMRGKKDVLNAEEIRGFNLFMGKANCATCHYMPLFSGNFPPAYKQMESEVIGVPASLKIKQIDPDPGRYAVANFPVFLHAFKTPTVRNADRTAPYMHNGLYSNLEELMDFYNQGGGAGLGISIENQTLPPGKLDLTEQEKKDIISFIKSLDSRDYLH